MTELETYLTNWLTSHDYELEVRECDDEFFYCDPLSFIGVATHAKPVDQHFLRFIKEQGCNLSFSNAFIPEFLHEVGHDNTNCDFEENEWEEYRDFERSFEGLDMNDYNNQLRYMTHPIELAATRWAIDYINTHPEEIIEMANTLNKICGRPL